MDALRLNLDQARRFLADRGQPLPRTLATIADSDRSRRRTDNKMAALDVGPVLDLRQHPRIANTILARPGRRRAAADRAQLPQAAFERLQQIGRVGLRGHAYGSRSDRRKCGDAQLQS